MESVELLYKEFVETVQEHVPDAYFDLLEKAYTFAKEKHKDQQRHSGEPYMIHPVHVAINLAKINMDSHAMAAGLLHDTLEDTDATYEELVKEFGKEIANLVEGVSKLRMIEFKEDTQYIENLRKLVIATAKDIRVIIIRLADRLHNMQTLEFLDTKRQQRIANEVLEIYAPLAHRLQIGQLRGPLEDWAFKYTHPEEYRWLYNVTRKNYAEHEQNLETAKVKINGLLKEEGVEVIKITHRIKHLYSLYKKLQKNDNDLSRVYDLVALRIIVPKISDCYAALGHVHREYKPMKGRIKDYIAHPKANGYTSLHTTVILENGYNIEVQIRTPKMNSQAEFGIAAHWQYKEGDSYPHRPLEVSWVKELAKIIQEIQDPKDLESVKLDLFKHRIFAMTPKADVIDLPEDSTAIDFAYHIHTDVGNQAVKARVNGDIKSIDTILQNGDIVEIITDKKRKGPSLKWLKFAKTNYARSKIKHYNRKKLTAWEEQLGEQDLKSKKKKSS
jgi:GTP diphosphokinase / guanosine-3',5'-bis(diphosphate) 3'-diphosphatase